MCDYFSDHSFFDDYKSGCEVCRNCGLINQDILIENRTNFNDSCVFYDTKYKYLYELKNYATYINLSQDAITLATDLYINYTEKNNERRILPVVCLYLASEELGYSFEAVSFHHAYESLNSNCDSCSRKFKSCYEKVEKFIETNYSDYLKLNNKNKQIVLFDKFEFLFNSFRNKYPCSELTYKDFKLLLNNLAFIGNDLSLINKSKKGNFLVCLLNYTKVKNFLYRYNITDREVIKFYGMNSVSFKKINEIYCKIMN
jgi:hypothetical protein